MEYYITEQALHDRLLHKVKIDLMYGSFKATLVHIVKGNVSGHTVLTIFDPNDFEPNMEIVENKKHAIVDDEGYLQHIKFFTDDNIESGTLDYETAQHFITGINILAWSGAN